MSRASFVVLACASSMTLLSACFDKDASDRDEAVPAPPAAPIAPTVGSAMSAPSPDGAASRGGRRGGRPGEKLAPTDIDFRVKNPGSGVELAVYADLPEGSGPHRAIVVVPGGANGASSVMNQPELRQELLDEGVAIFRFDPDGRGHSGGEEDLNGEIAQQGLRAVIADVVARDDIQDDQVGVFSYSYGIVMSSGALRNGQTDAIFLVDWEGPANRDYIKKCTDPATASLPELHCNDDSFWLEREASRFIGDVDLPYLRIQRKIDHVHGEDASHAFVLYEAALEGKSDWVRMNDLDPNLPLAQVEKAERPDVNFDLLFPWFNDWILDMFVVANGGTPAKRDHQSTGTSRAQKAPGAKQDRRGQPRGKPPSKGGKAPRGKR